MDQQTTLKTCATCARVLTRKRYPSGRLEPLNAFNERKYCCLACSNTRRDETKDRKATEAAQQATTGPVPSCGDGKRQAAVEFLMDVVNDETVDTVTRVAAAKALLPYQARKASGQIGKKEDQGEAAKVAVKGVFSPMSGPKVLPFRRNDQG